MRISFIAIAAGALLMQAQVARADDAQCHTNLKKADQSYSSYQDVAGLAPKTALKMAYRYLIDNGWPAQLNESMGTVSGTRTKGGTFTTPVPDTITVQVDSITGGSRVTVVRNKLAGYGYFGKDSYLKNVCPALNAIDNADTQVATAK